VTRDQHPRAARKNAIARRFVRPILTKLTKSELLGGLDRPSFHSIFTVVATTDNPLDHYTAGRQRYSPLDEIVCRERLGGLIQWYERAALLFGCPRFSNLCSTCARSVKTLYVRA
jgi:hypothetical protein